MVAARDSGRNWRVVRRVRARGGLWNWRAL